MTADHGQDAAGFAAQLRGARRAAGLTQAELAAKAGVGVRTVRDLERGRAARPQRTTVELLSTALGLDGEGHARFLRAARGASGVAPTRARPATLALPAEIPLYGRDRPLVSIVDALGTAAVVSLVGLAGVGKTCVALAVLHRSGIRYPGGVAGIAITDGAAEADILAAVASVFGVGRSSDLAERFRGAPALLMVDGVERSPYAVGAVRWLAAQSSTLRIVATGRQALALPDEMVVPIKPLAIPPAAAATLADLARYPAAALFLARLAEVRREPVADAEAPALAALVRRLGGLPLALELAAARGRVLDAGELLDRYGDRLLDLGDDPGQGLRTAVAGSYALLDPAARHGLRQLSAFRGRWSVDLAEDLLSDVDDPIALLDRLVGVGLVTIRGAGAYRFRLLDVVREFAAEEARTAGEWAGARRRHAAVVTRMAERAAPELTGATMLPAANRLDYVGGDVWAALAYAADDEPHTALRLAASLPRWWRFRGRDVAGRQWLRRLLDDPRTADADPLVRAWARVGLAQLAHEHGAGPAELPEAEAALATFQAAGDATGELAARHLLCALWIGIGGYEEARRHGEAALALATRTDRVRDIAVAQNNLTWHDIRLGELGPARRRLAAVDRLATQCGDLRLRVLARINLAEVARVGGRYDEAIATARRAAALLEELGDPGHRRRALSTVGLALAQSGRAEEAEDVLAELRAYDSDGAAAAIEGYLAADRGDRELAAEWFAAAASGSAARHDVRDLVEALVGLAVSVPPDDRPGVLDHLAEVCRQGGITLLPRERERLDEAGL